MLSQLIDQISKFKDLYYLPIDSNNILVAKNIPDFLYFFIYFLFVIIIIHSVIIYLFANLRNSYPYFRMVLISTIYAFSVSFFLGKIFQTFFEIVNFLPLVGNDLKFLGLYGTLVIVYVFEVLLVNNRLRVLYERRMLDSEPIASDIFFGVTVANILSIIIFSLVP